MSNELASIPQRSELTYEQKELLKRTLVKDATDDEFAMFVYQCNRTGLDPFSRQLYAFKNRGKLTINATIDGFRLIAERTGQIDGQLGPFWCGQDGVWRDVWLEAKPPAASKVGILRKGCREPFWGVAIYTGYVQTTAEGRPTNRWAVDPAGMLAKCAEGLGLRKAFPQELSGLYTTEEMEQSTNPASPRQESRVIQGESREYAPEMPVNPADEARERVKQDLAEYAMGQDASTTPPVSKYKFGGYVLPWNKAKTLTGKDRPTLEEIYSVGDNGADYLKWAYKSLMEKGQPRDMETAGAIEAFLAEAQPSAYHRESAEPVSVAELVKSGDVAPAKSFSVKSKAWVTWLKEVAKELPYYVGKDGEPDSFHVLGSLKKLGYAEFTDANSAELKAALMKHVQQTQEDDLPR